MKKLALLFLFAIVFPVVYVGRRGVARNLGRDAFFRSAGAMAALGAAVWAVYDVAGINEEEALILWCAVFIPFAILHRRWIFKYKAKREERKKYLQEKKGNEENT